MTFMNDSKKSYLKYNLLNSLKGPSFYLLALIYTIFLGANFYIRQQFFGGNGSSDLLLFFSAFPYISIIGIPVLSYKHSFSIYDPFIPIKNTEKILLQLLVKFTLYSIIVLLQLPACLLVNLFGTIDPGQLFTSIICLLFYGAAILSLSCFIEKLINKPVLSLLISSLILALFNSAHIFALYVQMPSVFVAFFKQISFAWHFDAAGKGIMDTRDLIYLASISLLFIILAIYTTEKKAGKIFTKHLKLRFTAQILFTLLLILNGKRWYKRIDFSQNKTYSISAYTKNLLKSLDQSLQITYYRSSSLSRLYPQIRDVSDFLTEYSAQNKNLSLLIKDPDKDAAVKTLLENYGIQSQQMKSVKSNSTEYTNVYSAIVLEYQGNAETIPFTMAANSLEYDLDGRIKHLLTGQSRNVNIIIGNGMSLTEDYSYLIPWLNSQGFIVNPLYIEDPAFVSALGASSGPLLVIGDEEIKIEQAIAIENYLLSNKGNGFFCISPFTVNIEDDWKLRANTSTNVVEMLENWGLRFTDKIAGDISNARITMYSEDQTQTKVINYPLWISLLPQENTKEGITIFWPCPLELSTASSYLSSSPMSFALNIDKDSPEKLIETNPFILESLNISNLEKSTQVLGAQITGSLQGYYNVLTSQNSNIIVIPDQYFLSSLMTGYIGGQYGDYRNFDFLATSLLRLNGEEELAQLKSKSNRDSSLYKINEIDLFVKYQLITYFVLFILLPLLIILSGVIFNVSKKR